MALPAKVTIQIFQRIWLKSNHFTPVFFVVSAMVGSCFFGVQKIRTFFLLAHYSQGLATFKRLYVWLV